MRRNFRMVRRPRKRAIWVNIPFGPTAFTETVGVQVLLVGGDWEAQFTSLANERAVLRAVVGEIYFTQTAVNTTAGGMYNWGIFITDSNNAIAPAFTQVGMSEFDWLRVGTRGSTTSVTASVLQQTSLSSEKIEIKSRRRLESRDNIRMCAGFASDAGSPTGVFGGILRFLIARD